MFPISDDNPTRITPFVTYGLIAVNVVVFLHELTLNQPQLERFFQLYAVVPKELTASFGGIAVNQPVPEPLTLVTSQFLHGGFIHIFSNMLFLGILGSNIEDKLGHFKYLIFYIFCGVLGALSQWFFSAQSSIPSLGASGAIAGIIGAYTIRYPIFFCLGIGFLMQHGIASLGVPTNVGMESGGIAYWAHAGGFAFGAILGPLLGLFSGE
ncbi:MAG TPA: rhomboid family intramembrane serine protease [Cyanophyceae cyanobacterium]